MDIRVVDRDAKRTVAILGGGGHRPDYLSLEVTERLYGHDDLTVELDARRAKAAGLFETERVTIDGERHYDLAPKLLVLPDGGVYENVYIEYGGDEPAGRHALIARLVARDPVGIPRRIIPDAAAHDTQAGPAETAILNLIGNYLGAGAHHPEDAVPDLIVGADQQRGNPGVWRPRFQTLTDYLKIIAQDGGLGWQSRWDPDAAEGGAIVVTGRAGEARQIALSIDDGTLASERAAVSMVDKRNVIWVAGQGEGVNRQLIKRHLGAAEPAGYRRRVTFADARDTDSEATLAARGDSRLRDTLEAGPVEPAVADRADFRYGVHWGLGDLMPYRSEFRDEAEHLRVTEVTSRYTDSLRATRTVVLGASFPDTEDDEPETGGAGFE